MTHTDRQQSDEQVNDSYNPMKISGHERSLSQAEGDHQAANHDRKRNHVHPMRDANDPVMSRFHGGVPVHTL